MARFRSLEHQHTAEPLIKGDGLTVERVRRFDQGTLLPMQERWTDWAFRLTLGGTRYVGIGARSLTLAPHTILWHAPLREPVRVRALPGTSADQIVVRLAGPRWSRWLADQPGFRERHAACLDAADAPVVALQSAPPQVLLVVRDLVALNEAIRPAPEAVARQGALLLHLLGELHFGQSQPAAAPERRQRVEAAQALLAANFREPPSLAALAAALSVSPRQLQRDFADCTGLTPRRYLNIMRLSEANALLADTRLPVATIAAELGYVSQTHFSTAFRQVYQCSPRELRAALRGAPQLFLPDQHEGSDNR